MMRVAVVDSGVANLASVLTALRALGAPTVVARRGEELSGATHVVLPGVGAFGAGIARLRETGLGRAVAQAYERGTPTLAICLGFQMLCDASDEAPGVPGLGIVRGVCRRLPAGALVPNLGWSWVAPETEMRWLSPGYAAVAHSYCLTRPGPGARAAFSVNGTRFVAALEQGPLLACQFHPEISGAWGHSLIARWLARFEEAQPGRPQGAPLQNVRPQGAPLPDGTIRRLVPCLDVREGRVVKGIRFGSLRDAGDPAERAGEYQRQGADEVVLLDIAASPNHRGTAVDTVRRVRAELSIPLTAGGGVSSVGDARRLLEAGADRVSVNSAALRDPALLSALAAEFGAQCVVLAIDARRHGASWEALTLGGREAVHADAVAWALEGARRGAGEILLTSWDRDGTRQGCDLALLAAVTGAVPVPVIASGGIGGLRDVAAAFASGASAVLAASVFHDGDVTVGQLKSGLVRQGWGVRQ